MLEMDEEQHCGSFLSIFYRLAGYVEGIYFLCCFSGDGKCFSWYQSQSLDKNAWVWFTRNKQLHFNAF